MGADKNVSIAVRELHFDGDPAKKIKVEIFAPYKADDGSYRCLFSIEGAPADMCDVHIAGIDGYQALALTFKTVAALVDIYNAKYCQSKLRWYSDDLGFHFTTQLEK